MSASARLHYILINLRFAEKVKGHKEIYLTLFKKKRNHYLNKAINHQTVNEWVSLNHTRKLVMSFVFNLFCFVLFFFLWFCFYNCFATMLLELVTNFQPVNIFISKNSYLYLQMKGYSGYFSPCMPWTLQSLNLVHIQFGIFFHSFVCRNPLFTGGNK